MYKFIWFPLGLMVWSLPQPVYSADVEGPKEQLRSTVIKVNSRISNPVAFKVSDSALSLSIQAEGRSKNDYFISSISDPEGHVYTTESGLVSTPYYPGYGTALFLTPSRGSKLSPGSWKLTISALSDQRELDHLKVRIFENNKTPTERKKLRVSLVLTGSYGLRKSTFFGSRVEKGIRDLRTIFSRYGIQIEVVEINDYTLKSQEVSSDGLRGVQSLEDLIHTPIANRSGLNIIFVESVNFGEAQGVSPGAPGVFSQSPRAGAIVISNLQDPVLRLKPIGLLLAHEIGHYLGLSHPYELGESLPKLLDAYNIMNPDVYAEMDISKYNFKSEQIRILKNHPLLD